MRLFTLFFTSLIFRQAASYLVSPPGTPAPGATVECTDWVQQSYGLTCAIIKQFYGMSAAQFEKWNPSVTQLGSGCNLIQGLYYCVQVNYVSMTFLSTGPPTTTSHMPTVTTSPTGITTPTPTQSGMVSGCNKFYKVVSGDNCYNIAAANGITLPDFYSWNPAVGDTCSTLWPDFYVCVGTTKSTPTKTTFVTSTTTPTGNGIATPTPTQPGMVANCNKFHQVVSGDSCFDISNAAGISLDNFYAWNPTVGNTCSSLWVQYYVCIGIQSSAPTSPLSKGS
ncbi:LysM domain-containing protein [Microsporum canis CBS 113480]|uniref:LysM domain-containing protein n=1 Tax=Arthroderma otae (strain ATCC MYA-4605 / CBS 113480) TaxID=554155 RepID=C5FQP2_ARTOC|nr:LysM domain-containing protein [Microsporum canis CBS 113480]EEQ32195.1 LysM domain-containing protein [Microsporum canis CBS 113480]